MSQMMMQRRRLHAEYLAFALAAVLSLSLSGVQLLWVSVSPLGSRRIGSGNSFHLGSVVGFASSVATASSFAPQQSSSPSMLVQHHPLEKNKNSAQQAASSAAASSATCILQASSSYDESSSFAAATSCSQNDNSILATETTPSNSRNRKMSKKTDLSNYHLIWSPGALRKMSITTFCLLVIPRLVPESWKSGGGLFATLVAGSTAAAASSSSSSSSSMHCHASAAASATATTTTTTLLSFWGRNFALPLAASSCCLLQLGLNFLSFGCAGWNSVLGPIRPYFLSLLLYTFITQRPRRPLLSYGWQALVALLPEMVHLYNKYSSAPAAPPSSRRHSKENSESLHQVDIELDIASMGCAACIASINHALRQQNHVVSASSQLKPLGAKGGTASIRLGVSSPNDVSAQIQALIHAVAKTGFDGATVTSVRTSSQKKLLADIHPADDDDSSTST
jgi:hypothetical protein